MICHRRLKVIEGIVFVLSGVGKWAECAGFVRAWISSSVEMICESCFEGCKSLGCLSIESGSKLSRIERAGFWQSGVTAVGLPASVEVLCEGCFSDCISLKTISIGIESKLSRIEREGFQRCGLRSIHFPASVEVIYESCFSNC
jgi:hypothetical protein